MNLDNTNTYFTRESDVPCSKHASVIALPPRAPPSFSIKIPCFLSSSFSGRATANDRFNAKASDKIFGRALRAYGPRRLMTLLCHEYITHLNHHHTQITTYQFYGMTQHSPQVHETRHAGQINRRTHWHVASSSRAARRQQSERARAPVHG